MLTLLLKFLGVFESGIKLNIQTGVDLFGSFVDTAWGLLTMNPGSFSSDAMGIVDKFNGVFVGLGSTLVVIFFLIGFFEESIDPKQEMRIEVVLKTLIKLIIAEFFVSNSLTIVKSLFGLVGMVTGGMGKPSLTSSSLPSSIDTILNQTSNLGNTDMNNPIGSVGFGTLFLSLIFMLIMIGCGVIIVYQAFARMIKLLSLIPYGALANSTLSGNHIVKNTAVAFWKYALCTVLEAVTMMIAIYICCSVFNSNTLFVVNNNSSVATSMFGNKEFVDIILWMCGRVIFAVTTCGVVKGASTLTQKVLGL